MILMKILKYQLDHYLQRETIKLHPHQLPVSHKMNLWNFNLSFTLSGGSAQKNLTTSYKKLENKFNH